MATATKQVRSDFTIELTLDDAEAKELRSYLGERGGSDEGVYLTDGIYFALKAELE